METNKGPLPQRASKIFHMWTFLAKDGKENTISWRIGCRKEGGDGKRRKGGKGLGSSGMAR